MATGRVPTTANSPLTAKGDLFGYSTTQARVAVGNDGETLVADSSATTGLRYNANFAAGKNKIINGDFGIWQRGTSFSNPANGTYCADRFKTINDGTGATRTISQQTFTPGTAPVAGYEGQYFMRYAVSVAGTGNTYQGMQQFIEDVRTFAGQTVTFSFWAKADATRTVQVDLTQYFGSGGSGNVQTLFSNQTVTTSWARYSGTVTLPSISGKTIGTGSALQFGYYAPALTACTIDIWGVQLEAGSVATAFQTATGTIQGELSACQRYYWRQSPGNSGVISTFGTAKSTTAAVFSIMCPTTMRKGPDTLDYSNIVIYDGVTGQVVSALTLGATFASTGTIISFDATSTSLTQYRPYFLYTNNANGYFGVSAEL